MERILIPPIPDIKAFPHILKAHKKGKLVIFVGAGLSAIWGCNRWKDMAVSLVNSCFSNDDIDYWVREQLLIKHGSSPRKLITIVKSILEDKPEKYTAYLKDSLRHSEEKKSKFPNLFNNLILLNSILITTNVDTLLSEEVKKIHGQTNVHLKEEDFLTTNLKPNHLFHLHGTIEDSNSLVLSIKEYISRYKNETYQNFLKEIFFKDKEYVLMFIGYGIDEMEIIDFMIEKHSDENGQKPSSYYDLINRFYVFLPFFENEMRLLDHERKYFDLLQMTVIPYSIDKMGYNQLNEIISVWRKGLTESYSDNDFYKFTKLIEDLDE